jgi:hypothetical protein
LPLHFAQTEDIRLKSALFGKNPLAMITGSNLPPMTKHVNENFQEAGAPMISNSLVALYIKGDLPQETQNIDSTSQLTFCL